MHELTHEEVLYIRQAVSRQPRLISTMGLYDAVLEKLDAIAYSDTDSLNCICDTCMGKGGA